MDRYEEAMERAKAGKPMDEVFPELKESEDEKIRREIIDFICWEINRGSVTKEQREKSNSWLAWLEKQKCSLDFDVDTKFDTREQRDNWEYIKEFCEKLGRVPKDMDELDVLVSYVMDKNHKEPIEELSTRLNGLMQEYVKSGKDEEEQEHRLKCYQLFWDALGDSEFFKQKEQQPVELIYRMNGLMQDFIGEGKDEAERKHRLKCYQLFWKALKDIGYFKQEQKPAHTAKEMWEEMRLEVYAQASGNRHEPNYSDDSTKMFSLRDIDEIFEKIGNSTVGSHHAEWSEEDERMVGTIISDGSRGVELDSKQVAWLKSLRSRPNWKPSEKQMKALNKVANEGALLDLFNDLLNKYIL